ncbi:TPA: O-antigen ligase family protein, partial [Streptococcus suis]
DMNQLYSFFYKVICIGIFACIVNFLLNFHELLSVSAITSAYSVSFSSFFANRNTFGILMLISIISNKYLIESRHYRFAKYIQILFFINILLTLSRTSIAGVVVFYFAYYLINIFGKNSSFNINKVLIGLVGICLGTFSLYLLITNQALIDRITILFIRTKNFGTAAGRTDVWKNGIEIGLNNNFWFGLGRYRALELNLELYQNTLPYFHSIYVETFVTYGFLGLSILISYFCNILSKTAKSSFIHKKITLASLICFFVISIFESTTRFSIGYADTISLIFFFSIPILIGNLHD